jgi:hypothetical protein
MYLLPSLEVSIQVGGFTVPRFYFDVRERGNFKPDNGAPEFDSMDGAERAAADPG